MKRLFAIFLLPLCALLLFAPPLSPPALGAVPTAVSTRGLSGDGALHGQPRWLAAAVGPRALTPEEARQAIAVLQDNQRRAELIRTLKAIASALPPPAKAAAKSPPSLVPNSLGAAFLSRLSLWPGALGERLDASFRALTQFPLLWRWLLSRIGDREARAELAASGLGLVLVFGCGLLAQWLTARALRRPLAIADKLAPEEAAGGTRGAAERRESEDLAPAEARAWRLLRRLPAAFARFGLELLPLAAFAAVGTLALAAASATARPAILALGSAYVLYRAILNLVRMLIAPQNSRLRLLPLGANAAARVETWARRIALIAVFGTAFADVGLFLGLDPRAHAALLRLVQFLVLLFLVAAVLVSRESLALALRGHKENLAPWRRSFAAVWHYAAIFGLVIVWLLWLGGGGRRMASFLQFLAVTLFVLLLARFGTLFAQGAVDRLFRPDGGTAGRRPRIASGAAPAEAGAVEGRFAGFRQRADGYKKALKGLLSAAIAGLALLALFQAWGLDALTWFESGGIGARLLSALLTILIAAALAAALWELADAAIERHLVRLSGTDAAEQSARLRTLLPMLRTVFLALILLVLGLTALSEIGVNVAPLLAGAGILGLAISFGSQRLVRDVVTGLFLLLENAPHVGDSVTLAGISGTVERLTIRTLWLRAGDGTLTIVPFGSVTTLSNTSRGQALALLSVTVAYHENVERVAAALREIAAEVSADPQVGGTIRGDFQLLGVDKVSASGVTMSAQIACTSAGKSAVQRAFNLRLKERFVALGIEMV